MCSLRLASSFFVSQEVCHEDHHLRADARAVQERLALLALAEQRGVSEEEALVAIIRDAVKQATRSEEQEATAE